jgi:glycosyltransferase involved in cell wall biosynthesis
MKCPARQHCGHNYVRIAHLPSSYFPEHVGGTETYVQTLSTELEIQGHESRVVWHTDLTSSQDGSAHVRRLPPHVASSRSHIYGRSNGQAPPGFASFLREWRPDVVHFHAFTLGAGEDHARCCRAAEIPYVITYHTPTMSCPRGTLLEWGTEVCDGRFDVRRCTRCTLHGRGWPKLASRVAALSPIAHRSIPDSWLTTRISLPSLLAMGHERWQEFFGNAAHVVACAEFCREVLTVNGIAQDRITIQRQALPGDDRDRELRLPLEPPGRKAIRLGYFGRLTPEKGPDLLTPAVATLRGAGLDVIGEWVGPVGEEDAFAKSMFALGRPHVTYQGLKRGEELANWIRSCDLIVIPSRWLETGPLTLLEAWDQGTPVIGADRGGIRDFMLDAGLPECLFDPENVAAISAAVRRMLTRAGPAPVVAIPGTCSMARAMIAIYENAMEVAGAATGPHRYVPEQ